MDIAFQNTISASIRVGDVLQRGAHIGKAGNSGTSYTPHIHLVFGFYDQNDRYWSTPIGKRHALKIYDQFTLNTSCFSEYYTGYAISRNFCYKNNE